METTLPIQTPAIFWDGAKQLAGVLELRESELIFKFDDFKHSHLNLVIQLSEIENAKEFLLFNVTKKGLKVCSRNDQVDLFILDDPKSFCEALHLQMKKI